MRRDRRTTLAWRSLAALTVPVWAGGGCTEPEASGPPDLQPGRDICAECGMSIVEPEFAAAALHGEAGRREHALFDDIGCLLVWQDSRGGEAPATERWVMGFDTRQWVPFTQAHFVVGGDVHTPMDSRIIAFAAAAAAERERTEHGGALTAGDQLTIPGNMSADAE